MSARQVDVVSEANHSLQRLEPNYELNRLAYGEPTPYVIKIRNVFMLSTINGNNLLVR